MNSVVKFKKIHKDAVIPQYKTLGAAGMDLSAVEYGRILPGQWEMVETGLKMELPYGYEAQVRPRSGLAANNGVTVLNAPGTIDSDYRGEIKVILINHGRDEYNYCPGERIAQLVIAPVAQVVAMETDELSSTDRGAGGMGSTGR
jgi:dUTP pyrophosphatase